MCDTLGLLLTKEFAYARVCMHQTKEFACRCRCDTSRSCNAAFLLCTRQEAYLTWQTASIVCDHVGRTHMALCLMVNECVIIVTLSTQSDRHHHCTCCTVCCRIPRRQPGHIIASGFCDCVTVYCSPMYPRYNILRCNVFPRTDQATSLRRTRFPASRHSSSRCSPMHHILLYNDSLCWEHPQP